MLVSVCVVCLGTQQSAETERLVVLIYTKEKNRKRHCHLIVILKQYYLRLESFTQTTINAEEARRAHNPMAHACHANSGHRIETCTRYLFFFA